MNKSMVFAALLMAGSGNADDSIYWGSESSGNIGIGNLDGSGAVSALISAEAGPCGVALNPASGKIYWTNFFGNGAVRVKNLDGTGAATTLYDGGLGALCGVAVDPVAGTIYWANFDTNEIRKGSLGGPGVMPATTIVSALDIPFSGPSGVTIDPIGAKIYWTNQNSDTVMRANLDGSNPEILYGPLGENNPLGVALNVETGALYWANLNANAIRVGSIEGSSSQAAANLYTGQSTPGGVALYPDANKIYWANFPGNLIVSGNLDQSPPPPSNLFPSIAPQTGPLFPAVLLRPVGSGNPTISGGHTVGQVLTCSQASWAGDLIGSFLYRAPRSFAFSWQRNGVDIPGATSGSYVPPFAGFYTCSQTATNQAGSTTQVSNRLLVRCTAASYLTSACVN